MVIEEARALLADELRKRDSHGVGDGVNMRLCIEYVEGDPDSGASLHDRRKLDAALAAIMRAANSTPD